MKGGKKRPPLRGAPRLLALCYIGAAVVWFLYVVLSAAVMLNHKMDGSMRTLTLGPDELRYKSFVSYDDLEWQSAPTDEAGWYLSTDNDPQIYWQGTAWIETVRLHARHTLPPGSVALYYLKEGQTDYSENQKVFADVTGEGVYTFDLGGVAVTGLRVDPDSVGGVPTLFEGIELNPAAPWYRRLIPTGGQWLLLLFAPALAAALLAQGWAVAGDWIKRVLGARG